MNTGKVKSGNRRRQVSKSTYYTLGDKTNGCSFMITAAPTYEECMIKAKEQIEKNKNGP